MPSINTVKFDKLTSLGFNSGTIREREIAWLRSVGATGETYNDLWFTLSGVTPPPVSNDWVFMFPTATQANLSGANIWVPTSADFRIIFGVSSDTFPNVTDNSARLLNWQLSNSVFRLDAVLADVWRLSVSSVVGGTGARFGNRNGTDNVETLYEIDNSGAESVWRVNGVEEDRRGKITFLR